MEDLYKAIAIFLKYGNPDYPTNCEHDELYVNIPNEEVSKEDKAALKVLGFECSDEHPGFYSCRFGSC